MLTIIQPVYETGDDYIEGTLCPLCDQPMFAYEETAIAVTTGEQSSSFLVHLSCATEQLVPMALYEG